VPRLPPPPLPHARDERGVAGQVGPFVERTVQLGRGAPTALQGDVLGPIRSSSRLAERVLVLEMRRLRGKVRNSQPQRKIPMLGLAHAGLEAGNDLAGCPVPKSAVVGGVGLDARTVGGVSPLTSRTGSTDRAAILEVLPLPSTCSLPPARTIPLVAAWFKSRPGPPKSSRRRFHAIAARAALSQPSPASTSPRARYSAPMKPR
jgi:hypothetical protein